MVEDIIKVKSINKIFGKDKVLSEINLSLKKGKIYGFIGENGAGKTTLMRIITGLSNPTTGNVEVGLTNKGNKERSTKEIGCIIESPALILELSAYENIKYKMLMNNLKDEKLIEEKLDIVGLEASNKKKVRNYSLGMRQRLAIAMALINDPKILILDEPINGLDPTGIVEMRKLLKSISEEFGITIFISSHILSELYLLASEYIFIHKGKIVKQLTMEEIKDNKPNLILDVDNPQKVLEHIKELFSGNIEILEDSKLRLNCCDSSAEIAKLIIGKGCLLKQMYYETNDLETYYKDVIDCEGDRCKN